MKFTFLLLSIFSMSAAAQMFDKRDLTTVLNMNRQVQDDSTAKNQTETYYFYVSFGLPVNSYPQSTQSTIDFFKELPGYFLALPYAGELGVYWPLRNLQTMLGVVAGFSGNYYAAAGGDAFGKKHVEKTEGNTTTRLKLNSSVGIMVDDLGVAAEHWLVKIGDGFYARANIGIAFGTFTTPVYEVHVTTTTTGGVTRTLVEKSESGSTESRSGYGLAILLGIGYGYTPFKQWPGRQVTFSLSYAYRNLPAPSNTQISFDAGIYTSVLLTIGILW